MRVIIYEIKHRNWAANKGLCAFSHSLGDLPLHERNIRESVMKKWFVIGVVTTIASMIGQGIAGFIGSLIGGIIGLVLGYMFYYKFLQ